MTDWPELPPGYEFAHGDASMFTRLHDLERAADTVFPAARLPATDDVLDTASLSRACATGELIVIRRGRKIVGASIGVPDGDDLHLLHPMHSLQPLQSLHLLQLAVHPDHGRRGLGRSLLTATAQRAALRFSSITLTTFADLPFNAPFYRKFGFAFLDEADASVAVRAALRAERSLGMTQRVAMKLPLAPFKSDYG
ncbi:MAG: GNAT family N-acetyltransferase [Pseudomonadaceae bacterium]|nr:GNAT family N-acetyltransferase [Pseudomonadaceae bacterium]